MLLRNEHFGYTSCVADALVTYIPVRVPVCKEFQFVQDSTYQLRHLCLLQGSFWALWPENREKKKERMKKSSRASPPRESARLKWGDLAIAGLRYLSAIVYNSRHVATKVAFTKGSQSTEQNAESGVETPFESPRLDAAKGCLEPKTNQNS